MTITAIPHTRTLFFKHAGNLAFVLSWLSPSSFFWNFGRTDWAQDGRLLSVSRDEGLPQMIHTLMLGRWEIHHKLPDLTQTTVLESPAQAADNRVLFGDIVSDEKELHVMVTLLLAPSPSAKILGPKPAELCPRAFAAQKLVAMGVTFARCGNARFGSHFMLQLCVNMPLQK